MALAILCAFLRFLFGSSTPRRAPGRPSSWLPSHNRQRGAVEPLERSIRRSRRVKYA